MLITSHHLLFLLLLLSSTLPSSHQTNESSYQCDNTFSFINSTMAKNLTHCKKLLSLSAELGWNIQRKTTTKTTVNVDIVFAAKALTPTGWVAWGLNPGPKPKMVGTRALIAVGQPNGGAPVVGTYNLTANTKRGCPLENSSIEFTADNVRSEYSAISGMMVVWATVRLPPEYNVSRLNIVWQVGPMAVGPVPLPHMRRLENFDSIDTIDLTTGRSLRHGKQKLREAHGILGVIGWGFLLPLGVIISRYFRVFPFHINRWFLVHVWIQITAFTIGTTAWGIGLSLISDSRSHHTTFQSHRIIGILIFCLATLQMMALWLKPSKADKYRKYWSIYHHFVGYAVMAFAVVNIFKGLSILRPPQSWKWTYIGILTCLSCLAFGLEIVTWSLFCWKSHHKDKDDKPAEQDNRSQPQPISGYNKDDQTHHSSENENRSPPEPSGYRNDQTHIMENDNRPPSEPSG